MGDDGMGQRPEAQAPAEEQQPHRRRMEAALSLARWKGARHVRLVGQLGSGITQAAACRMQLKLTLHFAGVRRRASRVQYFRK